MKLLSLNLWGGQIYEPLIKFIKDQSHEVDIFCFQEVMDSTENTFSNGAKTNLYSDLSKILKNFKGYLAAPILLDFDLEENVDFNLTFGQAIFVKKNLKVISSESTFVNKQKGIAMRDITRPTKKYLDVPRNIQHLIVKLGDKKLLVGNLHGFWMPISKKDSPHRIKQSKIVKKIFDDFSGPSILCGDFNLRPDTKSMEILEEKLRNLVVEFGYKSTRSRLHKRGEKYADYMMTSDKVNVIKFEVMDNSVSDHLPLFLEFTV